MNRSRGDAAPSATAATLALAGAVALIVVVTLWPMPDDVTHLNLIPFATFLDAWNSRREVVVETVNIVGNVALFVPVGFLAPLASRAIRSSVAVAAVGSALSVGIELAQLLMASGRTADITDVLLNTLGALVGYGVVTRLRGVRSPAG